MIKLFENYIEEDDIYDLKNICGDYMDAIERFELRDNLLTNYLNKIILNKNVEFYEKSGGTSKLTRAKINSLRFVDGKGKFIIVFFKKVEEDPLSRMETAMFVDLDKPIKVKKSKRLFSDDDPYGEEEWE